MKTAILYITLLLLLFTCKKKEDSNSITELRVWNATPATLYDCIVNPGSGNHNFGRVGIDSFSSYQPFVSVYSYGYVNLVSNNKMYRIQPIDYVGETPLAKGKYTYKITLSPTDVLETTLIKD